MRPARALFLRTIGDARIRALSFGLLFVAVSLTQVIGYRNTYPTLADRLKFAQTFGHNKSVRLFYGTPYDLTSVSGYVAWRAGGVLVLFAAFFGILAAIRAFRDEEETGRFELIAAGAISRTTAFLARAQAIGALIVVLWLATSVGLIVGRLSPAGSMYMALAVVSGATVYAAVGIVACQWLPTSRGALQLATGVLVIDFVLRVVADTADYGWMHWITPLGWIEEMRAFTGPRPHVLLLPAAATAILLVVGLALETRRDTGAALLAPTEEVRNPSLRFLGSPALLALRSQVLSVAIWIAAISGFAYVIGTASKSVASGLSKDVQDLLNRLGVKIATPSGYIGLTFLFFVFAISLFCCSQLAAMREDEAEGRLETLFALPASRTRWLIERLALAALAATLIAVLTGLSAALGARTVGADVSFLRLLGAGFNALPASLLFLGVGALLTAAAPRIGVGAAYAVVTSAFVWELVGALLSAPSWLLGVSPFHQVALVPAVPFRLLPAVVMLATGLAAATAAVVRFRTRDLVGA